MSEMTGYEAAQFWYDGLLPPEHNASMADKLSAYADKIEMEIRQDADDYGDMAIDAIAGYLSNEDGIPDDIMLGFKQVIAASVSCPFEKRHDPLVAFINAAIEWQARMGVTV